MTDSQDAVIYMTAEATGTEHNILASISYACGTDIGRCREENQDSYGVIENARSRVFIVADGMGGVKGGKLASSLAVDVMTTALSQSDISDAAIRAAITAANSEIFEKGREDSTLTGMGTTITGVAFTGLRMYLFNIGDSRVYRVRSERISQLSEDHTLVKELVDNGTITAGQAHNHPISHMLTRSLGPTPDVQIDCGICDDGPAAGDVYLMCSDGLYNLVSEREMLEILLKRNLQDAIPTLISLANQRGGSDNITIITVRVGDDFPVTADEYPDDERAIGLDDTVELYMDEALEEEEEEYQEELEAAEDREVSHENQAEEPAPVEPTTRAVPVDGGSPVIEQRVNLNERLSRVQQKEDSEEEPVQAAVVAPAVADEPAPEASSGHISEEIQTPLSGNIRSYLNQTSMIGGAVVLVLLLGIAIGRYFNAETPTQTARVDIPVPSADSSLDKMRAEVRAPMPIQLEVARVNFDRETVLLGDRAAMVAPRPRPMQSEAQATLSGDGFGQTVSGIDNHEMDNITSRRHELEVLTLKLREQISALDKPISGRLAEDLRTAARAREAVRGRLEAVQMNMDATARKLSVWYGRQKRLQKSDPLNLAGEVSVGAAAVRERKEIFERATWAYLQEADALQFNPGDPVRRERVANLMKIRKQRMLELNNEVRDAIEREVREADRAMAEFTLERDKIQKELEDVDRDTRTIQTILGGDQRSKDKLKDELALKLRVAQAELEDLKLLLPAGN